MDQLQLIFESSKDMLFAKAVDTSSPEEGVLMYLDGVFAYMDVLNVNRHSYTKANYDAVVAPLLPKIESKTLFGELEHKPSAKVDYNNISHRIESISYDESKKAYVGRIALLDNEHGRKVYPAAKSGSPLYISSRALGDVANNGGVTLRKLVTWDLTAEPGFGGDHAAEFRPVNESLTIACALEWVNESDELMKFDEAQFIMESTADEADTAVAELTDELKTKVMAEYAALLDEGTSIVNAIENVATANNLSIEQVNACCIAVVNESSDEDEKTDEDKAKEAYANDKATAINMAISQMKEHVNQQGVSEEIASDLSGTIENFANKAFDGISRTKLDIIDNYITTEVMPSFNTMIEQKIEAMRQAKLAEVEEAKEINESVEELVAVSAWDGKTWDEEAMDYPKFVAYAVPKTEADAIAKEFKLVVDDTVEIKKSVADKIFKRLAKFTKLGTFDSAETANQFGSDFAHACKKYKIEEGEYLKFIYESVNESANDTLSSKVQDVIDEKTDEVDGKKLSKQGATLLMNFYTDADKELQAAFDKAPIDTVLDMFKEMTGMVLESASGRQYQVKDKQRLIENWNKLFKALKITDKSEQSKVVKAFDKLDGDDHAGELYEVVSDALDAAKVGGWDYNKMQSFVNGLVNESATNDNIETTFIAECHVGDKPKFKGQTVEIINVDGDNVKIEMDAGITKTVSAKDLVYESAVNESFINESLQSSELSKLMHNSTSKSVITAMATWDAVNGIAINAITDTDLSISHHDLTNDLPGQSIFLTSIQDARSHFAGYDTSKGMQFFIVNNDTNEIVAQVEQRPNKVFIYHVIKSIKLTTKVNSSIELMFNAAEQLKALGVNSISIVYFYPPALPTRNAVKIKKDYDENAADEIDSQNHDLSAGTHISNPIDMKPATLRQELIEKFKSAKLSVNDESYFDANVKRTTLKVDGKYAGDIKVIQKLSWGKTVGRPTYRGILDGEFLSEVSGIPAIEFKKHLQVFKKVGGRSYKDWYLIDFTGIKTPEDLANKAADILLNVGVQVDAVNESADDDIKGSEFKYDDKTYVVESVNDDVCECLCNETGDKVDLPKDTVMECMSNDVNESLMHQIVLLTTAIKDKEVKDIDSAINNIVKSDKTAKVSWPNRGMKGGVISIRYTDNSLTDMLHKYAVDNKMTVASKVNDTVNESLDVDKAFDFVVKYMQTYTENAGRIDQLTDSDKTEIKSLLAQMNLKSGIDYAICKKIAAVNGWSFGAEIADGLLMFVNESEEAGNALENAVTDNPAIDENEEAPIIPVSTVMDAETIAINESANADVMSLLGNADKFINETKFIDEIDADKMLINESAIAKFMPEEYSHVWESLSTDKQTELITIGSYRQITSVNECREFFLNVDMTSKIAAPNNAAQFINESVEDVADANIEQQNNFKSKVLKFID